MAVKAGELEGKTYSYLTVLKFLYTRNNKGYWLCKCKCGKELAVRTDSIKSGRTTSCGCYRDYISSKMCTERNKRSNEYVIDGDMIIVATNNGHLFTIDKIFENLLSQHCFHFAKGYIHTREARKHVPLHRLLLNAPPYMLVDHKDGNPMNNCMSNLRLATPLENSRNSKAKTGGTSKYKGVYFSKVKNRYQVKINSEDKSVYVGTFKTEEEAALAYNEAAKKYHGEFARLNKVTEVIIHEI